MSAAARKRIAEAMRQRWAAAKKSGKKEEEAVTIGP
jgi:DNA invertase Pin-like site-specific DNA recombinase